MAYDDLLAPAVPCLATDIEGYVFVLDHMSEKPDVSGNVDGEQVDILYLAPHREQEQHTEIHDQDRPVDGDVKHIRGGQKDGDGDSARPTEPGSDLEYLGETAKERMAYQNCHSGNRLTNGLNSSSRWEGSAGPLSVAPSSISSARRSS